ncbi:WD40 repeat domain-containing serine/threonine protein kinase [Amycolatopsis solani]|uniref:WD40 repeat domain-containing serine/threonine protein kinase n=1 Tax=Amycolatopsis solani TaxID=3028615 RepID=UPI0025AF4F50|nr:WD40 repeat domain-containing serine/threonine protein kinase [Amycolatopsis sp. MEP2-6]
MRTIGPYRILGELGSGGMGRVVLGSGPDGRLVALKLVHRHLAEDAGFRARFREEVRASQAVSGAYTAAVVDADPDAETPWLASVHIPGPSLDETLVALGGLPEAAVLRLAAGLASALRQIHRAGLVHRDLKPSNVLLTDDGPRVIDFGIARATDDRPGITRSGWLIGSPAFMSPEQARSEPATQAGDIFSFGAVLVAAWTGASPFAGGNTLQTLNNVVLADPDLSPLPPSIREIVRPCLAATPGKRPTAAEVLESIGPQAPSPRPWPPEVEELIRQRHAVVARLAGGTPDATTRVAPPAPTRQATTVFAPPRRRLVAAAIVVVLAVGGVTAWRLWPQTTPSPTPPPAPPQLVLAGTVAGTERARWGQFSPDGRVLAVENTDGTLQLRDVRTGRQIGQLLGPFGENGPGDFTFTADSRTLVTTKIDGDHAVVQQWDVATGSPAAPLLDAGRVDTRILYPTLSPDGRTLAVADDDTDYKSGVYFWDIPGRRQTWFVDTSPNVEQVAFSEDGHTLAIRDWAADSASAPLTLWDATTRQQHGSAITLQKDDTYRWVSFAPGGRYLVTVDGTAETTYIRLWDPVTHNQTRTPFTIPPAADNQAQLSPDAKQLVTLSDAKLTLTDTADDHVIATLAGVHWARFSPDGRTIATLGTDGPVRLWHPPA